MGEKMPQPQPGKRSAKERLRRAGRKAGGALEIGAVALGAVIAGGAVISGKEAVQTFAAAVSDGADEYKKEKGAQVQQAVESGHTPMEVKKLDGTTQVLQVPTPDWILDKNRRGPGNK